MCGAGLLAITYLLVRDSTHATLPTPGAGLRPGFPRSFRSPHQCCSYPPFAAFRSQNAVDLHQLLVESGIALAVMAALAAVLGWLVAGRVLRPLRTITARTRRISGERLHDRLALTGPRDELRELADTIDDLLARLEAAFEAQRQFVSNASHELRTPLALMRTRLDVAIAKPGGVPPETVALQDGLGKDLDRAGKLLESFLALARAQHGNLADRSVISLDRVVADALATRHDRITEQRLEVHAALARVDVAGSESLLSRMVENLVENAVRHNQDHGLLEVTCDVTDDTARLLLESGGTVLDESTVADLARPFRRAGPERTGSRNGHGLGLAIVAAIVAAHDGELELHARPQGGLQVQVRLPRVAVNSHAGVLV